ncbi:MAG: ArsR family transcriptional regulator [Thermoplasmata archaeon]|nr:ArsR family transcriptional regulator [Thermoplasmata archaeon]
MTRVKVINDIGELVNVFRAIDTELKANLYRDLADNWRTEKEIEERFGKEGVKVLKFFEKLKLIETRWQTTKEGKTEKAYHTYYSAFSINCSAPIKEMIDVIYVAGMSDAEFRKWEEKVIVLVGASGMFAGDVAEKLNVSPTFLKGLVRRSLKLDYKGHRIELVQI